MSSEITNVYNHLERLTSFFVFNRRHLVHQVELFVESQKEALTSAIDDNHGKTKYIAQANEELNRLRNNKKLLEQNLNQAIAEKKRLKVVENNYHKLQEVYTHLKNQNFKLNQSIEQHIAYKKKLEDFIVKAKEEVKRLRAIEQKYDKLTISHDDLIYKFKEHTTLAKREFDKLNLAYTQISKQKNLLDTQLKEQIKNNLKLENSLHSFEEKHTALSQEHNKLIENHKGTSQKLNLICKLLAVPEPKNKGLIRYKELIQDEYLPFTKKTMSLDEAECFLTLQSVKQELELILGFPEIYSKTVISVAGGFSTGKSAFINSLILEKEISLAVGMETLTAIPTYVISDKETQFKGYSHTGGFIDLSKEMFIKLEHNYIKSLGFDLKKIMPYMSLSTPLKKDVPKHLCFIDTPGYDSAHNGFTDTDKESAQKFSKQADFLIWVIGLDSTGTIPKSDLKFIQSAEFSVDMYFIINKADLKPPNQINEILLEVEEALDFEGIKFKGISAYNSVKGEELDYIKESLFDFLTSCEQKIVTSNINSEIDRVFSLHSQALHQQIKVIEETINKLKSIRLDVLETGDDSLYSNIKANFEKLSKVHELEKLKVNLKEADALKDKFKLAVNTTIEEAGLLDM